MNKKSFQQFLNVNKKISFLKKNRTNIIVFDRQRVISCILSSVFASSLSQKFKSEVMVVLDNFNTKYFKIYKSFGFTNFFNNFYTNPIILFQCLIILTYDLFRLKIFGFNWFIKNFKLNGISCGDMIYDLYIRFDKSYLNPKIDFKFIKILFISIVKFKIIYKILITKKPKLIITNSGGYATISGISSRIAKKLNITVITPYIDKKKIISFLSSKDKRCKVYPDGDIKRISKKKLVRATQKFSIKKINKFILDRTNAKIVTNTTNVLDLKKNISKKKFSKNDIIKKLFKNKNIEKLILICPHAFSDCPHMVGDIFFRDYYNQLFETLECISKFNKTHNNIGWIVRPHPGSKRYGESGLAENIVKKINSNLIKLSPKTITADNLSKICENVITCTGTVGLEFALKGKYSVNAGNPYYSGLGFSKDHSSKTKFFSTLKNINNLKKLNKSQIILAKKALFYFEYFDKGISLEKSKILDDEIITNALKSKNKETIFCQKLIRNLKKHSFESDRMFKSIQNLI